MYYDFSACLLILYCRHGCVAGAFRRFLLPSLILRLSISGSKYLVQQCTFFSRAFDFIISMILPLYTLHEVHEDFSFFPVLAPHTESDGFFSEPISSFFLQYPSAYHPPPLSWKALFDISFCMGTSQFEHSIGSVS
jgi:hypothetical protein